MRRPAFLIPLTLITACARHRDLPVLWQVPPFQLTSQAGRSFDSGSLKGHVWIADFIFTHCPGPCLRMSSHMRTIESKTKDTGIRLVSFTVDPARDSPSVLAAFASKYQAETSRWYFLTGPQATLQMLSRDVFKLGDIDGTLNHQTRFVLVDKSGRVRGYYSTLEEEGAVKHVTEDARQLDRERS